MNLPNRSEWCSRVLPLFLAGVLGSTGECANAQVSPPISLHPENPHYFLWRGKPTVLVTSGEHYGALINSALDYRAYFEELAKHGLNHTRAFVGAYRETPSSFGITNNTLAPAAEDFLCPWARSDQATSLDGLPTFDLKRWDPRYFARLRAFLTHAAERGIVVELTLFCPMYNEEIWRACPLHVENNINGVGNVPRNEVLALKHSDLLEVQLALVKKIVHEVQGFDNLYFEICNEPYAGNVRLDWQHRIADAIVTAEQGAAERGAEHQHLISRNVANGSEKVDSPHDAVSILNFHYCHPPKAVAENYGLGRVIGENETGFRGRADFIYRTEAWAMMLAGGGLFNNLDYSFTVANPTGDFEDYSSPGGGSPSLRRQLGILKKFLESFDFIHMKPSPGIVKSVSGDSKVTVLSQPGQAYAICVQAPVPDKPIDPVAIENVVRQATLVLDVPAASFEIEWVDTKNGEVILRSTVQHDGGPLAIESPRFQVDIALRIQRSP